MKKEKQTININDAKQAIRVILQWIGEDPDRPGLTDTPKKVTEAFAKSYYGYNHNPDELLADGLAETGGYNEVIILRDIDFISHCEHHFTPITGKVHIGYLPNKRIVGISRLVKIVSIFAHRLQLQERLNNQIAECLFKGLEASGVVVIIEAKHNCLNHHSIERQNSTLKTRVCKGIYSKDSNKLQDIMTIIER